MAAIATDEYDTERALTWTGPQLRGFRAARFVSIAAVARHMAKSISRIRQLEREAAPNASTAARYLEAVLALSKVPTRHDADA